MQAYLESIIGKHGFVEQEKYDNSDILKVYEVIDARNILEDNSVEIRLTLGREDSQGNKYSRNLLERNFIFLD